MSDTFASFDEMVARHDPSKAPAASFDELVARNGGTGEPVVGAEAEYTPVADQMIDQSPIGRVLDAFGQGAKEGWGAGPVGLSEQTEKEMRQAGIFNDYEKGQTGFLRTFNEAIIRPAAAALDATLRAGGAALRGGQEAVSEVGKIVGQPQLARDIAAIPEAFFGQPGGLGTPRPVADLAKAKDLRVVGDTEAGWRGTVARTPEEEAAAVNRWSEEYRSYHEAAPKENIPEPAPAEPAAPAAEPDVHSVARQIAPDTFREYDALAQRRDTFRRWLDDLSETRRQDAEAKAPHGEEIADLTARLEDATPRMAKKYQARLDALIEERNAFIDEATARDTPDMARVRQDLLNADYRMRDLSPEVSRAYREARETLPEETPAEAVAPEASPAPAEAAPSAAEAVRAEEPPAAPEAAPEPAAAAEAPARINIADDVAQKLVAAGRPAEEAHAAAAIVASHYEARAARFKGAKGTAEDLYRAEGPEIRRGREAKSAASAKQREFAQPEAPKTEAFKNWFGDSKAVDKSGEPLVVYHGTTGNIEAFDAAKLGENTGAPSARVGFFFTDRPKTADYYARGKHASIEAAAKSIAREDHMDAIFARAFKGEEGAAYQRKIDERGYPNVVPAYLSLQNPLVHDFKGKVFRDDTYRNLIDQAKADGHDGVILKNTYDSGEYNKVDAVLHGRFRSENIYVAFRPEQIKSAVGNRGTFDPTSPKILEQSQRGKIRLDDGRATITLFRDADASTFIHETGHQWLEELLSDAKDARAPADLIRDAKTVRNWLGAEEGAELTRKQHEQFARGFERYMMEGVAPSRALAEVFAKFKAWLTKIYETVAKLRSPINADIRDVFDRLISANPEKQTVIAAERERPSTIADRHDVLAEETPPARAWTVADTVQAEAESEARPVIPEVLDEISGGSSRSAGGGAPEGPRPDGNRPSGQPDAGEAGGGPKPGAVDAGGGKAAPQGAGARPNAGSAERARDPVSANDRLAEPESRVVDKAGNIRLDNLGTPEDVNLALREAAAANDDFMGARRGVISDAQVLDLADALGMDPAMLNGRKLGQAFNAEEVVAARKLLIRSATDVRDAMAKAASGTDADVLAYAEVKARHQMIQEQVAGITAEAGRALRAFRALEGTEEAAQIGKFLEENTGRTLFQLRKEAQLGMKLETPQQVSKLVHDSKKPGFKDMIVEAWISALLSGPKTHMANILGNALVAVWRPVETATAAAIGKARSLVTGSQDRVLMTEAAAEVFGMVRGAQEGVVAAWTAFKTEEPQFTSTRQVEQKQTRALPSVEIGGMEIGGKQARIPLRLLTAEDELFKAMAFRGSVNRQAAAMAAREGLSGTDLANRVAELSQSPTEAMIATARKVADYQTFQTPLGPTGRAVQQFANSHILAKLVIPFVRTPINLLKYAGERTPLGLFSAEVRANLSGANGAAARDTQIARITLGTAIGAATFGLASQGLITGGGPADPHKRALMRADGWQPYSFRVGEMLYAFDRLDPFSIIAGLSADAYDVAHAIGSDHPEMEHIPAMLFASVVKNVTDRASLRGPSQLIQAVSDPERFGPGYIKSQVGTVIPALSAQTAQAMDPVQRETRTILDGLKARIPGLSQTLFPKRDVWGEPMVREGALGPDFGSPIQESRLKHDPVDEALLRVRVYPGKLENKIRGVELSDRQYDDFARIAGRMAKQRADQIVAMPGFANMPEGVQRELLSHAITTSREAARGLVMMQNPSIIKAATDAKISSVTGPKPKNVKQPEAAGAPSP